MAKATKMLHRKQQISKESDRIEVSYSKLIEFERYLKFHKLYSSNKVQSMARINKLFQVQTNISEKVEFW